MNILLKIITCVTLRVASKFAKGEHTVCGKFPFNINIVLNKIEGLCNGQGKYSRSSESERNNFTTGYGPSQCDSLFKEVLDCKKVRKRRSDDLTRLE